MNKYAGVFPITTGIDAQADDLAKWRRILNNEAYAKLQEECIFQNSTLVTGTHSGYDVFRGDDLTEFVLNLRSPSL